MYIQAAKYILYMYIQGAKYILYMYTQGVKCILYMYIQGAKYTLYMYIQGAKYILHMYIQGAKYILYMYIQGIKYILCTYVHARSQTNTACILNRQLYSAVQLLLCSSYSCNTAHLQLRDIKLKWLTVRTVLYVSGLVSHQRKKNSVCRTVNIPVHNIV